MNLDILEYGPECLEEYGRVPISFRVDSIFRVIEINNGLGGLQFREELIAEPYLKDYDEDEVEGPSRWTKRFDVSNWVFLLAHDGGQTVGAATVVSRTPSVNMLDDRNDLAVLWDLRVHPEHRRCGVGRALFSHAVAWSRARGLNQMKIETQNTNVRACRFYTAMGCHLGGIHRYFYLEPQYAHEVALFWYLDL